MKSFKLLLLLGLTLMVLNGCLVVSLHPLWTKETREFHTELIGEWIAADNSNASEENFLSNMGDYQLCFENQGDSTYLLTYHYNNVSSDVYMGFLHTDKEEINVPINLVNHSATLVNLHGTYFLDLSPPTADQFDEFDGLVREMNYLPVHTIFKLEIKENSIVLWELNDDRLEELFDQKRVRLDHEEIDDFTVITASTEELQRFLIKYADDEKAFEEPVEYFKKK